MNIFDKRPLSLILCIMLGGFVVFSFFGERIGCLLLIVSVIIIPLPFIFKRIAKFKKIFSIAALSLFIALTSAQLYFNCYFNVSERFEEEVFIEGTVVSAEQTTAYSASAVIKTDKISKQDFLKYNILIEYAPQYITPFDVGDKISFYAVLMGFENKDGFDSKSYYNSQGINAYADNIRDISIIETDDEPLAVKMNVLRETLRRKAVLMSDEKTGNLLGALLTGDRTELSPSLSLDFLRIGITHILALSGMHLAILSLAVERILRLLKIPKKPRVILSMCFCVIYMIFVGLSASILRAGIMLIISSVLFLLHESYDSFTSLCISVFLIITFTPYAVYDIALWLSAFATLGVIVAMDKERNQGTNIFKKLLLICRDSVYVSVLANGATLAISVFCFGGFSLLSPISTLIFSLISELYMYIGSIMLLLGVIYFPLSKPLGWILMLLYDLISNLSSAMSSLDFSYIITDYTVLLITIIVFTALFFSFLIIKLNKRVVSSIILVSFFCVFIIASLCKVSERSYDQIIYSQQNKSDLFLIKSESKTALISSSQYSKHLSYDSVNLLKTQRTTILNKYIITHYSLSLEEDLFTLLSNVLIKEIYLPYPENEDEMIIYEELLKLKSDFRFDLKLHKEGGHINIGKFKYYPLYSLPYGEGASKNACLITYKDTRRCLYLSSGMLDVTYSEIYSRFIDLADIIVFGSHGGKYKENIYIDDRYKNAEKIILASQSLYLTQKAYLTYKESECEIYSHPPQIELFYCEE